MAAVAVELKLAASLGPVQPLVVGHYGEMGGYADELLELAADAGADKHWQSMRCRDPDTARGIILQVLRRSWGMAACRLPRKRAPHRSPPWARGRRARVCDHPELGVDAPSAPACIRERSRALPVCEYLRQARQTTLGESGVAKLAECNLGPG